VLVLSQFALFSIFIPQSPSTWLRISIQPWFGWLYCSYLSALLLVNVWIHDSCVHSHNEFYFKTLSCYIM